MILTPVPIPLDTTAAPGPPPMPSEGRLSQGKIFRFWYPLSLTWLMMSVEGPFLAAIVARMPQPKLNLAAYGVAFAIAIIVEAPIIMIMSASTALARDRISYTRLRTFTFLLNALISLVMIGGLLTGLMAYLTETMIGLPSDVARLTVEALYILLPWPAAIGTRRFYQGILISSGSTRMVAYGTIVRLATMSTTGFLLYTQGNLPGVWVGACALSAGVTLEAVATRWMASAAVKKLLVTTTPGPHPTYKDIALFYYPLAITSTASMAVHPTVQFFVGHGRMSLESLAVLPVVNSLVFIFRSFGLSFQEAAIALSGENQEYQRDINRFAWTLALGAAGVLGLIVFTPLASLWFGTVSGLSPQLSAFCATPSKILFIFPAFTVLISMQRAYLIKAGRTGPITRATILEVGTIVIALYLSIYSLDMIGAVGAAAALVIGRLIGTGYLVIAITRVSRSRHRPV